MKNCIISLALALSIVFVSATVVYAADNGIGVTVHGEDVDFGDTPPVLVDGRTLVPVREVFEALGFVVDWYGGTQTVTLTRDDYIIIISLGDADFTTNDVSHALDVPAQMIDGRTMLPIRLPLESVGYVVGWDSATSTVIVGLETVETVLFSPAQIFAYNVDAVFVLYTYDMSGNPMGSGSGFFIDPTGIAVTCHHVMVGARYAVAVMEDGRVFAVNGFYSYDVNNDWAIIHVDGDGEVFPYLVIGDSDAVRVGDSVFAIGSPLGEQNTFAISYVSRIVPLFDFGIYSVENMIQITAPIYPGSSGGALFNELGQVVGFTAARDSQRANVAFVVPISHVEMPALMQYWPLPIRRLSPVRGVGRISFYEQFPFVPDFLSISPNASLIESGTPAELNIDGSDVYTFDYVFVYELDFRHYRSDTDWLITFLTEHGFVMQYYWVGNRITEAFFHSPSRDVSVAFEYSRNFEELAIFIGQGNALFEMLGHELDYYLDDGWPSDSELVGSWLSPSGTQIIHYFADGTGLVETFYWDGLVVSSMEFMWAVEDGELGYIAGPFSDSFWYYEIDGSAVTFISTDSGQTIVYTRISD